jgi:coatomer subunit beta
MPKAVEYIVSIYDMTPALDEGLQTSIIEVMRLGCKNDSSHRVRVVFCVVLYTVIMPVPVKIHSAHL